MTVAQAESALAAAVTAHEAAKQAEASARQALREAVNAELCAAFGPTANPGTVRTWKAPPTQLSVWYEEGWKAWAGRAWSGRRAINHPPHGDPRDVAVALLTALDQISPDGAAQLRALAFPFAPKDPA